MINISELKNHVTHFSEELRMKTHAKDEVTIGGKVIGFASVSEQYFDEVHYVLTLDDRIGTTKVIISECMFDHFKDLIISEACVLIKGIVNVVSRKVSTGIESQYSVVGFDMMPAPSGEVTTHA